MIPWQTTHCTGHPIPSHAGGLGAHKTTIYTCIVGVIHGYVSDYSHGMKYDTNRPIWYSMRSEAVVNRDPKGERILELLQENKALRAKVARLEAHIDRCLTEVCCEKKEIGWFNKLDCLTSQCLDRFIIDFSLRHHPQFSVFVSKFGCQDGQLRSGNVLR